jgi:hypothetical protein
MWHAVTKANGGCGLRWMEPMVVVIFAHEGGRPTHVYFRLISLESWCMRMRYNDIYLFKKFVVATALITSAGMCFPM